MITAPDHIRNLAPYRPGKPIRELERELGVQNIIKLASNENPLAPSPGAVRALAAEVSSLHRYPDGSGYYLKRALSERYGLSDQQIILGNGSNELLDLIVRTFHTSGMNAVSSETTFVVYPLAMRIVNGEYRAAPLKEGGYDLEAMARLVDERTFCVFIANPNNPTGTLVRRKALDRFFDRIPDSVLVVLDEAYFEYVEDPEQPDGLEYLKRGRNVMVLRTFSKIYGLAGLRIGYGMADPGVIDAMNRVREPFNTGTLAQTAALAALEDREHIESSLRNNREGKSYLYRELERLGFSFLPTEANFIWMDTKQDAGRLYEALLHEGVIVRPMGERHLRVTIGLPEENRRLVKALRKILESG